ncbi:DUF5690 family protein [Akkermansiaceae bacterium]|nr:DUF5690 family protein [Akkermansiaceae bacterium]
MDARILLRIKLNQMTGHKISMVPSKFSTSALWTIMAVVAAFVTYYCMYAFRKPFAVLEFEGQWFGGGVALKSAVVVSQLIGYVSAKFIGTRVCSGLKREQVSRALILCIVSALGSLALLGVLPPNLAFLAMILNGLSLGMVWGMVMRPLEGRGQSEFLLAGLCCSFIIASGDVKSTGQWVLNSDWFSSSFGGVDQWMPFATALIYLGPFLIAAFLLGRVPAPSDADVVARSERAPMAREDRMRFIRDLILLLVPLAATYLMLTAFRDYRDNFQAELFGEVGVDIMANKKAFSISERWVAFGVLSVTSLVILVKKHLPALRLALVMMIFGAILTVGSIYLRDAGMVTGMTWMILSGLGTYISYILVHCVIFERLVALTRSPGNSVFAMMLFDGIGYLGPIAVIPLSDVLLGEGGSRLAAFDVISWVLGFVCILSCLWVYFTLPSYQPGEKNSPLRETPSLK